MSAGRVVVLMAASLITGCVTGSGSTGPFIASGWDGGYASPYDRGIASPYGYGSGPFGGGVGQGLGRTFRASPSVVCDRATETCYRRGQIDASETRDVFGRRAAREVDRVRDWAGTNRIYRASDDVTCNRSTKICYKNGHPDRSETRDYFGKKAARRID